MLNQVVSKALTRPDASVTETSHERRGRITVRDCAARDRKPGCHAGSELMGTGWPALSENREDGVKCCVIGRNVEVAPLC